MLVRVIIHYHGVVFIRKMEADPRLPSRIMFAEANEYKVDFDTIRSCKLDFKEGVIVEYDLATEDEYSPKALEALGAWSQRALISEQAVNRGFDIIIRDARRREHEDKRDYF